MASSPSAAFLRLRAFIAERMRMVGLVLTGNGITACGDGRRSPISGSVNVRVGFVVIRS